MNAQEALRYLKGIIIEATYCDDEAFAAVDTLAACIAACNAAMEWAAAFPLGIASTEADINAAADVYRRCNMALKGEA